MRGDSTNQGELLSYVSLEDRIPDNHPIRKVRKIVDTALAEIETSFDDMYSSIGRPSIPPEQLHIMIFNSLKINRINGLFTIEWE
jgi:transposase